MNLGNIFLGEISQTQKNKWFIIPLIWVPRADKSIEKQSRIWVPGVRGREGQGDAVYWLQSFCLG